MAKSCKRSKKRNLFRELMSGVEAMRGHREGRLNRRTHEVEPIALPTLEPGILRDTREALRGPSPVHARIDEDKVRSSVTTRLIHRLARSSRIGRGIASCRYSRLAARTTGTSGSASFHNVRSASYALRLSSTSPESVAARARPR